MSGGNRVIAIYARELMRLGHTVTLVAPKRTSTPMWRKLKDLARGRGWPEDGPASSHFDGGDFDLRVLERAGPVTEADVPDADVVIATWWETAEWVAALSARKGAKAYFIQHHEVFPYLPVDRCRATYRLPLHKIVIARWLQDLMASDYADDKADLVPNAVDRAQFFAPVRGKQPRPTVGYLYSRVPFKGLDVTLAALTRVRQSVPELKMVSFGSHAAGADALPEGTEFILNPPQDRIRDIYARCDVWATASTSEGFNLPAMEAMACRTPVVSTRTGWPAEAIVARDNGCLVDVDDVEGLAEAITWVLRCPEAQWQQLSARAYQTVATSSWQSSALLFEAALRRAIERTRDGQIVPTRSAVPA
jgi:glycosyltransferase involved in cell wall biosynthesis